MTDETLEILVGKLMTQSGLRLAVAESCTGGLIGHRITNVPGSSAYYMGGVITYSNEAKMRLLGVHQETLEQHGAVSQETVLEMARGVRQALEADIGISVSGIAGPDGGTADKPVGLVWIGFSAGSSDAAWKYNWIGDRLQIKEQAAEQALRLLVDFLTKKSTHWESTNVTARFDPQGKIIPLSFTWRGSTYTVDSIGRRWQDEAGLHILVMAPAEQVYELVYAPGEQHWYAKHHRRDDRMA